MLQSFANGRAPSLRRHCSASARYYGPSRHPLVFGRLLGFAGYTAYLAPAISRWDVEGFSKLLSMSSSPCCSLPPRRGEQLRIGQTFGCSCCLRPTVAGSALGDFHFRGHNAFTFVTCSPVDSSWPPLGRPRPIGFRVSKSPSPLLSKLRGSDFYPGRVLPPAEHASLLRWTHNRTCRFPASGFLLRHQAFALGRSARPRGKAKRPSVS